jgi:CBS domain-containing protein
MRVQEIMAAGLEPCSPDANLAAVAGLMWDDDCGALPVVDGDGKVIGMITDRDICIAVATKHRLASEIPVSEVMSGVIHACHPNDDVRDALKTMGHGRVLRLPVIDEDGTFQGVLSFYRIVPHAEGSRGKRKSAPSYEDVVGTLKAICEQRFPKPVEGKQQEQRAASA